MEGIGRAKRVRIYLSQGDRFQHRPVHRAILQHLRAQNARGATVFGGVEGFGATGEIHGEHLADVGRKLPLVVEWIDSAEVVARLVGHIQEMVPEGLITVEDTEIVLHQAQSVRDVPRGLSAGDVMSKDVSAVPPGTPLREVVEHMLGKSYRAVPVVEGGVPVGIITNADLARRGGLEARLELVARFGEPERRASLERLAAGKTAADVMTPRPTTVVATATVRQVAGIMAQRRLKRLPVVDEAGALVGMVSRLDILRTAAGVGAEAKPPPRDVGLDASGPLSWIMRTDAPVVHPDTPLPVVLQAVMATRLNRALVVDAAGKVVGLVSDAELLERLTPSLRPGALRSLMHRLPFSHPTPAEREAERHAHASTAKDLMVREVAVAPESMPIAIAIGLMLRSNQKVLAVTGAGGKLAGIVDRADLLHGLLAER